MSNLRQQLLEKTGIDFEKYRSTGIAEAINKALNFPSAATSNLVLLPTLLTIVFVGGGIGIGIAGHWVIGIIFALLALVSMPFSGFILGLGRFAGRVVNDTETLFGTSLSLVQQIAQDILTLRDKQAEKMPSFGEIVQGINQLVILPIATEVIRKKVPMAGERAAKMVETMLAKAVQSVKENADALGNGAFNNTTNSNISQLDVYCNRLVTLASNGQQNIGKLTSVSKNLVVRPLHWMSNLILLLNLLVFGTLLLTLLF